MSKLSWQQILDFQKRAHSRIHQKQGTPTEIETYRRYLVPSKLSDINLPQIPLVKVTDEIENLPKNLEKFIGKHFALIGEVAQMPGYVMILEFVSGKYHQIQPDQLDYFELVTPDDL